MKTDVEAPDGENGTGLVSDILRTVLLYSIFDSSPSPDSLRAASTTSVFSSKRTIYQRWRPSCLAVSSVLGSTGKTRSNSYPPIMSINSSTVLIPSLPKRRSPAADFVVRPALSRRSPSSGRNLMTSSPLMASSDEFTMVAHCPFVGWRASEESQAPAIIAAMTAAAVYLIEFLITVGRNNPVSTMDMHHNSSPGIQGYC